jgi:hypothetical protein
MDHVPARIPCTRRTFLSGIAAAGVSLPFAAPSLRASTAAVPTSGEIGNDFLTVAFDPQSGSLSASLRDGRKFLTGAVARANLGTGKVSTAESRYHHAVDELSLNDRLGRGRKLVMHSTDGERRIDFEIRVGVYEARSAFWIEAECRNVSPHPMVVESLEPVCAQVATGGSLHWPGVTKVLTNGPMYYDPGKVIEVPAPGSTALRSWWNVGFFRGYDEEGLACGFIENQTALGQVVLHRSDAASIGLAAEAILARGFELPPGRTIRSGRFLFSLAPDPYAALESYAEAMGQFLGARIHSVVNGWCNWFTTFEHITEEEMLRNAEFAARTLKPLGLEYIQVDEGFQRWHGDWEGNARFPHGMKWLAERIRELGLKPGIWLAPYVISEPTDVCQKHPDWLLRHPDGRLKRVGPWPSEDTDWARNENPKRYGLDITHPRAAAWLAELFETVGTRWGYEMVKIDFVDWSLLSAHRYYDPSVSRAEAYRKGFEIMRRGLGPKCHLQDCGPGPVTVGVLDSMRIELDQNYGFRSQAWKQYFLESTSSAPAAAKRYYFHKRTWVNDADHVCLNLLSLSQAQAAASLLALTGGNLISGDRLPDLDSSRLDILRKIFPSYGEAARPIDLFDTDRHSIFALTIRKRFATWTVAGVFNASEDEPLERAVPLRRLGLEGTKRYLAYDFWGERLHGEVTGELRVKAPPASVVLLALHEKRDVPQVISTDRHVLQGALELEGVVWNADTKTLAGTSLGPLGSAHNVTVYIPAPQPWIQGGPFLFRDFSGYTLKMMNDHLLRIRVRFDHVTRVPWQVDLKALSARP